MNRALALLLAATAFAAAERQFRFGADRTDRPNLHGGIEFAELAQNRFRNLGPDNYTVIAGQRFWFGGLRDFGWRAVSMNVELSSEHLRDTVSVKFIEGNRADLTGGLAAHRLYWDWYPITAQVGYVPGLRRYALSVRPLLGAGLGWTRWTFTNARYGEDYDLRAFSINATARLQTELFELVFVETPVLDFLALAAKNRSAEGWIGDTHIARPETWALFGWMNVGIRIRF